MYAVDHGAMDVNPLPLRSTPRLRRTGLKVGQFCVLLIMIITGKLLVYT